MRSQYLDILYQTLPQRALEWKQTVYGYEKTPVADHTALRVTGGIGDLIMALGPAEALDREIGDLVLYSKWPEIAQLFTALPCRHEAPLVKDGLDIIINLNALCVFQFSGSFRGFRTPELADIYVRNQGFLCRPEWRQITEFHPYLDNMMGRQAVKEKLTRYDVTFATLGLKPEAFRRRLNLPRVISRPYVTFHDGFDVNNKTFETNRATKTWSLSHWKELVAIFRNAYPDLLIVQIGGPTSRRIPGVHVDRVGMLTFGESLGLLEHSLCHIDGDSGLTHAAHVLGTPTVALYGPTPRDFFGYPDNVNISPNFCGDCWWLKPNWVAKCPAGYEIPECMESIPADQVFRGFVLQSEFLEPQAKEALWKTKRVKKETPTTPPPCSPTSSKAAPKAELVSVNISLG